MALFKVTTCDDTIIRSSIPRHTTIKISKNDNWLTVYVQSRIEHLTNPLVEVEIEEARAINIIKVKVWRNPTSDNLETYNINISTFEDGQPEEFLALLNNFRTVIYGTGTMSPSGRINYLRTMLRWEALRELDELASHNNGTTNAYLDHVMEGLLGGGVGGGNQCPIQAKARDGPHNAQKSNHFVQAFLLTNNGIK